MIEHEIARSIAHDTRKTLSETVALLIRRGLETTDASNIGTDPVTGFPLVRLGRTITTEDVRAIDDEEVLAVAEQLTR